MLRVKTLINHSIRTEKLAKRGLGLRCTDLTSTRRMATLSPGRANIANPQGERNQTVRLRMLLGALYLVALLNGCTTTNEFEQKCNEVAPRPECPPNTRARIESDYREDVSGMDDARCRAMAGASLPLYEKCRSEYKRERQ